MRNVCRILLAPALLCFLAAALPAQDTAELLNRMRAMEDRIKALEAEVHALKNQPAAAPAAPLVAPAAPEAAQEAPPPAQLGGAGGAAAKALNPDISVIGDFVGGIGNHANRPVPALEMHESEARLPGDHRPLCARRFLHYLRRAGRRPGRGLPDLHCAPRRPAIEGRQDARRLRQGEYAAQPCAALGGPSAGHPEPGGRRGRHRRCRPLAEPHPAGAEGNLPGGHGAGFPRRQRERLRIHAAQPGFHGGPPARLHRPERVHQHRSGRCLTRAATARSPTARISSGARMPRCAGSRCAAPSITRSSGAANWSGRAPFRRRAGTRQALRLLRLGRLPVRAALVPGRPLRPVPARTVPAHQSGDRPRLRRSPGARRNRCCGTPAAPCCSPTGPANSARSAASSAARNTARA